MCVRKGLVIGANTLGRFKCVVLKSCSSQRAYSMCYARTAGSTHIGIFVVTGVIIVIPNVANVVSASDQELVSSHVLFLIDIEIAFGYERPSCQSLCGDHTDWSVTIAAFSTSGPMSPTTSTHAVPVWVLKLSFNQPTIDLVQFFQNPILAC